MAGRAMNEPRRALLFAFLLAVAACSPQPDAANTAQADPPLAGAAIGGPFTLTGESGTPVSDRDFAGQYRIMYFGYTFCPDVCPVDMQNLGAAMRARKSVVSGKSVAVRVVPGGRRDSKKN